jgi:hypothetical protein
MSDQAFINGFLKRAADYGVSEAEAIELLKEAAPKIVTKGRIPLISKLIGERRAVGIKNVKHKRSLRDIGGAPRPQLKPGHKAPEPVKNEIYNRPSDKTIAVGGGVAATGAAAYAAKKIHDKSKDKKTSEE